MLDKSEKIKNYSIAIACIVVCIFFVSYIFYLNKKIEVQSKLNKDIIVLNKDIIVKVDQLYEDYKLAVKIQSDAQLALYERSESVAKFINEISLIVSTRFLESEELLRHAEADMIVIDSIRNLQEINPRITNIINILNKKFINSR